MKFSFKKYLYCLFVTGHEPNKTHGYYGFPAKGSHCIWCGKEF